MELTVPTCFDERFAVALHGLPVRFVYGSMPDDPSARPGRWLPQVDLDQARAHIELLRSDGVGFVYALNAACSANAEFTGEGQRWLAERLGWLADAGAAGVVTPNPYVIDMVKRRFPDLRVHVSSLATVDTADKALFFQDLGADAIYLPEHVNRDFKLLRALRRKLDLDVVVMVNLACLLHCPIRLYHANCVSHASEALARGCYLDYSLATCTRTKALRPVEVLRAPWIRPEDLSHYEEVGVHQFKIAGREQGMGWILRAATAYAERRYAGPLNDLIAGLDTVEPFGRFPVTVDNTRLDGFVEFFKHKDCRRGCEACTHCDDWTRTAATVDGDNVQYARRIEKLLTRVATGAFRPSITAG